MLDIDIIYLISKYCKIRYLKEISKIINFPSKIKNRLKYFIDDYEGFPIKCIKCNNKIHEHIKCNNKIHEQDICYSECYNWCRLCGIFYHYCPYCNPSYRGGRILCQFLGFNGIFINCGNLIQKFRIIDKSIINQILDKFPFFEKFLHNDVLEFNHHHIEIYIGREYTKILYEILDRLKIKYNVSDLDLEYFDTYGCYFYHINGYPDKCIPVHYWKCLFCHTYYGIITTISSLEI